MPTTLNQAKTRQEVEIETMVQTLEKDKYQIVEKEYAEAGEKIRVMIVDTHMLMRGALHRVVSTFHRIRICASLGSLDEAARVAQKTQAQVIILSSSISVSACLDLIKLISEDQPSAGIVVIQRCLSPETTMTFIKRGVQSLLGEEASEEDLAKAITAAATGNTFLDRGARELLDCSVSRAPIYFTRREVEVLSLLKCGESNFRIAHALGMREKTVEKHLTHIYEKLNINSRTEAILQIQRLHI
jgi:DNA-binding NarL/FixJ family response regulator